MIEQRDPVRTVLVTGATGRQGGGAARALAAAGWRVRAFTAAEVQQGKQLADLAREAGVAHYIYASVGGAERGTRLPAWESKWAIEEHIRAIGLPATVLRPATFMEGFLDPLLHLGPLFFGSWRAQSRVQVIASQDVGAFAALALERPGELWERPSSSRETS